MTGHTWRRWTSGTMDTATTDASGTWTYWVDCGTASTCTASGNDTWTIWTNYDATSTGDTTIYVWGSWCERQELTEEEKQQQAEARRQREAEAERLRIEAAQRAAEEARKKEKAEATALELLKDLLTDEEMRVYEETGRLLVKGRSHDYLINRDSGWVNRLEKGKVADLCMHLENHRQFARHDNVIAMKLFIEGKEDEFNREANLQRRRDPDTFEADLMRAVNQ